MLTNTTNAIDYHALSLLVTYGHGPRVRKAIATALRFRRKQGLDAHWFRNRVYWVGYPGKRA